MNQPQLVEARSQHHLSEAAKLFADYAGSIGIDLEFQGFSTELASLPGDYAPPAGAILLFMEQEQAVACVALRRLEPGICEMKRMYVAPAGRGRKLGRRLAEAIISKARTLGYAKMRLDTLASMTEARALYRSLGFVPIAPYCHNPLPNPEFYELKL
jgi:ribosomal protein S18 acetylase RimI-like enzyme